MVIGALRIHTLFAKAMIDSCSTHYFVLISFAGLLDIHISTMNFDLIVATPMGDFVVTSRMLKNCDVMIGYREMPFYLALLDLQDFDVILGMDWLTSYHSFVDYFGKQATFSISSHLEFSFEGKWVDKPLHVVSTL